MMTEIDHSNGNIAEEEGMVEDVASDEDGSDDEDSSDKGDEGCERVFDTINGGGIIDGDEGEASLAGTHDEGDDYGIPHPTVQGKPRLKVLQTIHDCKKHVVSSYDVNDCMVADGVSSSDGNDCEENEENATGIQGLEAVDGGLEFRVNGEEKVIFKGDNIIHKQSSPTFGNGSHAHLHGHKGMQISYSNNHIPFDSTIKERELKNSSCPSSC
ncbi:hypothetical protein L2E82_16415 [Cichorium intybus]|uniref:Uncharacterized protein n=2 Tax=Cichorium intybus TaxID=13427 RepID=A0ACB9F4Z7_CICIN|nr:hypothetical protein L2E82_16414 [Cichorium intybus]KAI3766360.1 hypothetical protein L2E82_16415 [Cichorium intybus]